jgi:hypothetical protein
VRETEVVWDVVAGCERVVEACVLVPAPAVAVEPALR